MNDLINTIRHAEEQQHRVQKSAAGLLFWFLRAAAVYGHRAGQVDERFCREVLGVDDPRGAVLALVGQGFPVRYTDDGAITLHREVLR